MIGSIGIDLGSRRTKMVLFHGDRIEKRHVTGSWTFDREEIKGKVGEFDAGVGFPIGTTGYGRQEGATVFHGTAVTEIRAFAHGVRKLLPAVRTIVDVGGQDSKTIHLDERGRVTGFEMNDKCAAGTGKFFEMLAGTLRVGFDELPRLALGAGKAFPVSSTCAVFAESEIIGHLHDGVDPAMIARGVFRSVAERLHAMLRRSGFSSPAVLVGGGANACLAAELASLLGSEFTLPEEGIWFGAVGAAVLAQSSKGESK